MFLNCKNLYCLIIKLFYLDFVLLLLFCLFNYYKEDLFFLYLKNLDGNLLEILIFFPTQNMFLYVRIIFKAELS